MLGPTPDRRSSFSAEGNAGVEPPHESRPSHDPVELYSHAGSQEVWLQNHAVTVLAKHKFGNYLALREESTWFKIRNREYSQTVGREKLCGLRGAGGMNMSPRCGIVLDEG